MSAIQRFEKRSSGPDGSTKSRNKGGRSGKDSFIVYNAARSVSPESKLKIQRPDERNRLITPVILAGNAQQDRMDKSFPLVMVAAMAVVTLATVWLIKRFIQPPTAAGKKRLTIFLRFVVAQYVILTALVLLSVEQVLPPRLLGVLGIANLIGSSLIMWTALKRAPISDRDITREQRVRAVKSSKLLIAIYVFALINGLFHIGELPSIGIVVGIVVNVLILIALITNLRRNQAKLDASNQ